MSLSAYGWNETWEQRLVSVGDATGKPARVVAEHRSSYRVYDGSVEIVAQVSGRLRHAASSASELPAVGDWVVIEKAGAEPRAIIQAVLPRSSSFSRKAAGTTTEEQVVAANIDTVWIVSAFGSDLNAARIERYVALVTAGGASPCIVLTKADLCEAPGLDAQAIRHRVGDLPVHGVSALDGTGLDPLLEYLAPGKTIALLGSSGVGKSTLLNRLAGREIMQVGRIHASSGRGRHKTTHRQLVLLPSGGLLLDTPGMRELQLWTVDNGIQQGFAEIERLAEGCRFSDCSHESEPGCAVQAATENGELAPERLASYQKLKREAAFLERKVDVHAALEEKRRWKRIKKEYRRRFKGPKKN